jgi:hypothetical protein
MLVFSTIFFAAQVAQVGVTTATGITLPNPLWMNPDPL